MEIRQAAELLGAQPQDLHPFRDIDPFNAITVAGFICRRPDHRYGALVIYHADGPTDPQVVYGTPKMGYPFDRAGRWAFPPAARLEAYEKLDGTNVLAFSYRTASGKTVVSYKTRLMPFLGDRRMGSFLTMWRRLLDENPGIEGWVRETRLSASFEMYGSANRHLIDYRVPLAAAFLFAITADGKHLPPSALPSTPARPAPLLLAASSPSDLRTLYEQQREEMGRQLRETGEGLAGMEGAVWYLLTPGGTWRLLKLKAPQVEEIHFAEVAHISREAVRHACYRAMEDGALTVRAVEQLLLEDWEEREVRASATLIERVVAEVEQEEAFRQEVLAAYRSLGLRLQDDRGGVMRALSGRFPKAMMRRVYRIVADHEGLS